MASRWCELLCPQPKQVASESMHGARLAAQQLSRGRDACDVEAGKPCQEETAAAGGGRVAAMASITQQHHSKPTSTFAQSVINMVGMLIGLGQLSTPYALENGGWASIFLLVGLGIMCAYTAHIIGKCLDEEPRSKTYQDIGQQAFGSKGRLIASAFIYLEIFFALVSYTISLSDTIPLVFAGVRLHLPIPWLRLSTTQLLTVIAVLVALPSLWLRNLSSISCLSFAGILMSMVIFVTILCTAAFGSVGLGKHIPVLRLDKIPTVSGLYMFSYAGHIVFPNIYTAMKDPSSFTKVSVTSFSMVALLYTALAFVGASLFGPSVNSQVTLSMPPGLLVTKVALWATVLTPVTKYALEFAPFAIQLEHHLPATMGPRARIIIRGSIGSAGLLIILALALSVPYFQYVLSLTGSLISVAISVIFPCAFYVKIRWGRLSRHVVVLNAAMIAVGFVLAVVGTASSAKLLVKSIQNGHVA
ncbi:amino acid transporter AVT1H-like [Triticum urartu]|uniref:Amino acid transporter transmembrane domain-containing protein n=1 Tax=Triticum urartu TaxID=4572 RepID=A0A8R7U3S2_TRIUA|nr:amino acid transporter AVT1H-like [Triticum urartu]XP_048573248.1 amino acid transporter AVT1H-like [Triticum urartu]